MGKVVYIVRHAKSSWSDMTLSDKDRPLNKRGHRDAPVMAKWCVDQGILPDKLISSTAVRAASTAEYFTKVLGTSPKDYSLQDNLYHAPAHTYIETCYGLDPSVQSVMMFGHNPGITYLANEVADYYVENVPTCGILIVDYHGDSWQTIDTSQCTLRALITPKSLSNG